MKQKLKQIRLRELLVLIASDDKEAFGEFFCRYHSKMNDFARLFVKSQSDVDEVVASVVERLLNNRKKILRIQNFENYLFRSIKNACINFNTSYSKTAFTSLADADYHCPVTYQLPYDNLIESELRDIITKSVETLPLQRKMVYKLIKDEGLKIEEAAKLMNLSEKTIKNHLSMAIGDLRKSLEGYTSESSGVSFLRIAKVIALLLLFF